MRSESLEQTAKIAAEFVKTLVPGRRARVVALEGDLGAGKTTFTQSVARALGVEEVVQSPTFVIAKFYGVIHPHFKKLVHIDCYRLERSSELERIGWEEIAREPSNLVLVEWPERVPELIPGDAVRVKLSVEGETSRRIDISDNADPHA